MSMHQMPVFGCHSLLRIFPVTFAMLSRIVCNQSYQARSRRAQASVRSVADLPHEWHPLPRQSVTVTVPAMFSWCCIRSVKALKDGEGHVRAAASGMQAVEGLFRQCTKKAFRDVRRHDPTEPGWVSSYAMLSLCKAGMGGARAPGLSLLESSLRRPATAPAAQVSRSPPRAVRRRHPPGAWTRLP